MERKQLKRLEAIAAYEFNYVGEDDHDYAGNEDEFDYGGGENGGNSFIQEIASDRTFQFTLVNTAAGSKVVALSPAMFTTTAQLIAAGYSVDAIFGDGAITADITATASGAGQSITVLREFFKLNPVRVTAMSMTSSKESQFEKNISIEAISPFSKLGSKPIILSRYRPAGQLQKDKIEANLLATNSVIELNNQNLVLLTLEAASTLNVIFYIGAISNPPAKLAVKAKKAHRNIRQRYPHHYAG